MEWMKWLKSADKVYRKAKRFIAYLDLTFIVVVFYAGHYLAWLREKLLPAAIIGSVAIVLESLFSINDALQGQLGIAGYSNILEAVPKMGELVQQGRRRDHNIKIIAASGGTTVNTILPALIEHAAGRRLDINLLIIDPEADISGCIPEYWREESRAALTRLTQIRNRSPNVSIHCRLYSYIPCVRGILIDDHHLFLGFFSWAGSTGTEELSGAQQEHSYYRRENSHETRFRLFETWFKNAPARQAIPSAGENSEQDRNDSGMRQAA